MPFAAYFKIDELMETETHDEKTQNLSAVKLSEGSVSLKDVDFK